jgi:hypothetical protein
LTAAQGSTSWGSTGGAARISPSVSTEGTSGAASKGAWGTGGVGGGLGVAGRDGVAGSVGAGCGVVVLASLTGAGGVDSPTLSGAPAP